MARHENPKGPKTFEELKEMIESFTTSPVHDRDVYNFVCTMEAHNIMENMSALDFTEMLMEDGVMWPPINTPQAVNEWLETHYEENAAEDGTDYWYTDFPDQIESHFS